jgi:hypothetical protein
VPPKRVRSVRSFQESFKNRQTESIVESAEQKSEVRYVTQNSRANTERFTLHISFLFFVPGGFAAGLAPW